MLNSRSWRIRIQHSFITHIVLLLLLVVACSFCASPLYCLFYVFRDSILSVGHRFFPIPRRKYRFATFIFCLSFSPS